MRNPIEIDYSHSRAILQEIGERLRTLLKEDRELPAILRSTNRPPPPVRGRVAASCEVDDVLVGTPPRRREAKEIEARSKCSVDGTPRELRYLLR